MLFIDIGSTYTKLVVIDIKKCVVVAAANSPTTIEDVSIGFSNALKKVKCGHVEPELLERRYASSSAAGGLRMIAIGLVPSLTMEAAKRAALGAGAKVIDTFSFMLTTKQVRKIEQQKPDIILLAGGTDGGEKNTFIHNSKMFASSKLEVPVILAGNSVAVEEAVGILEKAGKYFEVADNVMPTIGKLNVESVRDVIREIFIKRIIVAKGLNKINQYIDGIALPTPLAVLEAAKTFAEVVNNGVLVIDVGGATTDVHSVCDGVPSNPKVTIKGLPEPYAKRTVEGDLGVRYNIGSIVEAIGKEEFIKIIRNSQNSIKAINDKILSYLNECAVNTSILPKDNFEEYLDLVLASTAANIATNRHAGYLEEVWTPDGKIPVQYGKDLSAIDTLIGTGGPIINSQNPSMILSKGSADKKNPFVLKPKNPQYFIDKNYILFSIGLMRQMDKKIAREIARNYLKIMEVTNNAACK